MTAVIDGFGMDGLPPEASGYRPESSAGKRPIDIEALLQMVIGQSGRLPWRGTHPRELMVDGGYTVVPKGCVRDYHSTGLMLSCPLGPDARRVMELVMGLEPAVAAMVIACAREGIRPQWQPAMRRVAVAKRHKRKHRRIVVGYRMEPPSAEAICQARGAYTRWHQVLGALALVLADNLDTWQVNGFGAPAEPWLASEEEAA